MRVGKERLIKSLRMKVNMAQLPSRRHVVYLPVFLLGCLFVIQEVQTQRDGDIGYFWQMTDIHYDKYYKDGSYPKSSCRTDSPIPEEGSFDCDTTPALFFYIIYAIGAFGPDPDFILWTGDNVPHVPSELLNKEEVLNIIETITGIVQLFLPNATVFPTLGAHDHFPANEIPPWENDINNQLAVIWKKWITTPTTFKKGGYYSDSVGPYRVVVLNTVLYYAKNTLTTSLADPAGQFQWLEQTLQEARSSYQWVIIVASVPPGFDERSRTMNMHETFNDKLVEITSQYADIIKGQFYGHQHFDAFRVQYDKAGSPISSLFIAPSVTPLNHSQSEYYAGARNPAVRRYTFNRRTGTILDYQQFLFTLDALQTSIFSCVIEYNFTTAYGVSDLSPKHLDYVINKIQRNELIFQDYHLYGSVMIGTRNCDKECEKIAICAMKNIKVDDFKRCANPLTTDLRNFGETMKATHRNLVLFYFCGVYMAIYGR